MESKRKLSVFKFVISGKLLFLLVSAPGNAKPSLRGNHFHKMSADIKPELVYKLKQTRRTRRRRSSTNNEIDQHHSQFFNWIRNKVKQSAIQPARGIQPITPTSTRRRECSVNKDQEREILLLERRIKS